MNKLAVNLTSVPETMLWTLYNRASEAQRRDTYLPDRQCVRIHDAIAYDYQRSFGKPQDSHAMRSRIFDDAVKPWIAANPGGTVVELAVGLETQFQRCDDGQVQWFCVDVPDAIALRENFLPATPRCRYISKSALDLAWMDEVDASHGVFVTVQGLFMYFQQDDVERLFRAIVERFAGVEIMFDAIPRWFSQKTLHGLHITRHYVAPPMPWGINRDEVSSLLKSWSGRVQQVTTVPYGFARGLPALMFKAAAAAPGLRNVLPTITHVRTSG